MENENVKKFQPVNIGIKPSLFLPGQVGLFALRDLRSETIITENTEEEIFVTREEYEKLDDISKGVVQDFCELLEDGFYTLPDLNKMPISWMCNHSCEPNVGFDEKNNIVCIRSIQAGEELVYDYAFIIRDPNFSMECKCGSKNCRKLITGNDWKDPIYFEKNKKYMCTS